MSDVEDVNGTSPLTVDIARNCDVIIVVGPEKRKLRVNSEVLKNVSPVFNAMLGPHFKEGQHLTGYSLKEVHKPEDNADALTEICKIVHLRNDLVSLSLTPSDILDIALTLDKYDCFMAVEVYIAKWLKPDKTQDIMELGRLLTASYLLRSALAFERITFAMIFKSTGSYVPLVEEFSHLVPSKIFLLLEERRSFLRMELQQLIVKGWNAVQCRPKKGRTSSYLNGPVNEGLWGSHQKSIFEVIDALEKVETPSSSFDGFNFHLTHESSNCDGIRKADLQAFKNSFGLHLDCVLSNCTFIARGCSINHMFSLLANCPSK